jgi:hypothetical protein
MLAFLLKMPKGGDLHSHLSGAVYAESYIQWAAAKGSCVNQATMALSQPPCDQAAGKPPVSTALTNTALYQQLIDAWLMRYWQYSGQNGHDHFFHSFGKFGGATFGQMLADVSSRAAKGHVSYLELMLTPDGPMSSLIGLQYAFLPGKSLWADAKKFVPVPQCARDIFMANEVSSACTQYLAASEKARLQWKLEEEFKTFENQH